MSKSPLPPLSDVVPITVSAQKTVDDLPFPLILSPAPCATDKCAAADWIAWVADHRAALKLHLLHHAAILFRGFELKDAADFDQFVKAFGYEEFPYVGGAAARQHVIGSVFTANEAPADATIPFHHEMAQVPNFPAVLFFHCAVVPAAGGATPLVPSHVLHALVAARAPALLARLEREGVRYVRVAPSGDDPSSPIGRGWQATYQTEDRVEAERRAGEAGTQLDWLPDGSVRTTSRVLPATRVDQRTGRPTFFNSIVAAYTGWTDSRNDGRRAVLFGGSGDVMPSEGMDAVLGAMGELSVAVPWEQGDVLMVDNRQALHAREPYTPPRRILACLCAELDE